MLNLPEPSDDGLFIPDDVNKWSREKHHFLGRYLDAFTTSMRKKKWTGLHYIDLFAGAGIERLKDSGELDWGSPLIAAQIKYPFDGLHLCDKDKQKYQALKARLDRIAPESDKQILNGDANEAVHEIVSDIPERSLSLAFLDPYGLHLGYETLQALAGKRTDLIIFFPDRMDAGRNWRAYYWDNPESNLDSVLGSNSNWRNILRDVPPSRWFGELRKLYCSQIGKLGYDYFDVEAIPSSGQRMYWLIFCSKHKMGGDIWRRTALTKPDNQKTFDFGSPD